MITTTWARCFYQLKNYLDDLLSILPEPDYKELPFVGDGLQLKVELQRSWLDQNVQLFIGVRSPLEPDKCVELMGMGGIDMKVGSSDRIEKIYASGRHWPENGACAGPQAPPGSSPGNGADVFSDQPRAATV